MLDGLVEGALGHSGWACEVLFWWNMFEFLEGLLDITGHGAAKFALFTVPVEGDPNVLLGLFINLEWVFEAHNGGKMVQILGIRVLDAKIVNNKGKGNITEAVEEEFFCPFSFDVPMLFKMLD